MRGYGALTAHGGRATAGADDVYAVGPPRVVLPHLEMDSTRKRSMRRTRGSWRKSMRLCSSRKHGRSRKCPPGLRAPPTHLRWAAKA